MRRAIVVLALLAACSSEQKTAETPSAKAAVPEPPPAADLRERLATAPELAEFEFTNASITMPTDGALMNEATRAAAKELERDGWLASDPGDGDVWLTEKSRGDRRFLLRENGMLDIVPLAKKQMGEVTAVQKNADGTFTADFTWTWAPNEVGASLRSGWVHDRLAGDQTGRATFLWDGTSWVILKIER